VPEDVTNSVQRDHRFGRESEDVGEILSEPECLEKFDFEAVEENDAPCDTTHLAKAARPVPMIHRTDGHARVERFISKWETFSNALYAPRAPLWTLGNHRQRRFNSDHEPIPRLI
jgi:hypothetical protein